MLEGALLFSENAFEDQYAYERSKDYQKRHCLYITIQSPTSLESEALYIYTSCFSSWPFRLSPLGFELCLVFSRYFCASFLVVVLVFFAILFHLSHLALLLFLLSFVVVMVVVVVVLLPLAGFHRRAIIGAGRLFWS